MSITGKLTFSDLLLCGLIACFTVWPHSHADAAQPKVKEVIIVCKQHFDIGYTVFAREVLDYYRGPMFEKALRTIDTTKDLPKELQFVWTVPGWPMKEIVGPKQDAAQRARILDVIREGRVVLHAMACTTHTESLDLESYVRGFTYSSDLCRQLGLPLPRDAKMTDVPSHAWITPTLLSHAGVDFFHFAGNTACKQPEAPPLFWWEGPDGTRILTVHTVGYGTGLTPPKDWPYSAWLYVMHTGDNCGPPNADQVKKMITDVRKVLPHAKVKMGRLSDFYDAIRREKNPEIPVVRGDMPDTWIYGIMSLPQTTKLIGEARVNAFSSMTLQTHLALWGKKSVEAGAGNLASTLDKFYEKSILYGEHTWGGETVNYGLAKGTFGDEFRKARAEGRYKTIEAMWDEHREYARAAARVIEPQLIDSLETLANSVAVKGDRIVVFNPLPFMRDGVVELAGVSATKLIDVTTHEEVQIENHKAYFRFVAKNVPPSGYKTYRIVKSETKASDRIGETKLQGPVTLENAFYRITVDPERGGIVSLFDKQRQKQNWIATNQDTAFGQYQYERFDTNDRDRWIQAYNYVNDYTKNYMEHDFGKLGMASAEVAPRYCKASHGFSGILRQSPVGETVVLKRDADKEIPHKITLTFSLYRDLPYIDIEWRIDGKPAEPWPEAGWLSFTMNAEDPQFRAMRLGTVVDPTRDFIRGSSHRFFAVTGGVSCTDQKEDTGVVVCPIDSPVVSLGERGLWHYTPGYVPVKPAVYVNLYNNLWSTNFAQWIEGSWSSRVRVWINSGDQQGLIRGSRMGRVPLRAAVASGWAGKLPPTKAGLTVSSPSVVLTALGPNPDGDGNLLRLWNISEASHEEAPIDILLPSKLHETKFQPCDLRGRSVGTPVKPKDGQLNVSPGRSVPTSFIWETPQESP